MCENSSYNGKIESADTWDNILHVRLTEDIDWNNEEKHNDIEYIVVDEFAKPFVYYNYLKQVPNYTKGITFMTKGEDKCLSVACASLISRYIFLKEFDKLGEIYNAFLVKGAGPKVDELGVKLVKTYGEEILSKISKLNFKNTEKIKELAKN